MWLRFLKMSNLKIGYIFVVFIIFVALITLFEIQVAPLRDKIKALGKYHGWNLKIKSFESQHPLFQKP